MIEAARNADVPVVVDPKGEDYSGYRGATLITPNRREFEQVAGRFRDNAELEIKARAMAEALELGAVLVTRGEEGMSLIERRGKTLHIPARAREVFDVTGAGDTVIATLGCAYAVGAALQDAIELANIAAGIVVGKLGAATAAPGGNPARTRAPGGLMVIVTGGAGFIGANIVKGLNERGIRDVLVVDDLEKADKFKNLVDCEITDYLDKRDFIDWLQQSGRRKLKAIFHEGACSDTMEHNGAYMMQNNFEYSKELLHYCQDRKVPFLYASSAAVYGAGKVFREAREHESPLNVYGYSKFLFDQYVRRLWPKRTAQVAGFRYFNVYGDREQHKGRMASVAFHQFNQFSNRARSSCSRAVTAMDTANSGATSFRSRTWSLSIFTFWTIQKKRHF